MEQWQVPARYEEQNGVSGNHHPMSGGVDVNGDKDFQPVMSSTQRPPYQPSHRKSKHMGASAAAFSDHVTSQTYAPNGQDPSAGRGATSQSYPSPDFIVNGGRHSRTNSGEFQPLHPEPDNDSESGAQQGQDNEFWPLRFDLEPNKTWHGTTVPRADHQLDPEPSQSFHSIAAPTQRHHHLLKHRAQLEQEQAWLRQKLNEQEELMALKQAQLTETELLYLRTGEKDYRKAPDVYIRGASVEPPPIQRRVYGALPGMGHSPVSTNFPPEEFDEFGQPRVLTESMHELGLGHMVQVSPSAPHHRTNNHAGHSPVSSTSSSRHGHRGRRSGEREEAMQKGSESPARSSSRNDGRIDGYASLHSAGKRKHRGRCNKD